MSIDHLPKTNTEPLTEALTQGERPGQAVDNGGAEETLPRAFGEYDLLERLGQGGMGVVYKARHRELNRIVALKLLRPDLLAEDQTPTQRKQVLQRFQLEIEVTARLNHPNLLTVFDVDCHDGRHFFTMRYVEGRSLADFLRAGSLPERQVAAMMETIARAVHAAHSAGVLHRDLKPGNVLLDLQQQPHVSDFGLGKFVTENRDLTRNMIVGTPGYMSPEQARGEQTTTVSDLFSLGTIFYHLLTGKKAFPGTSLHETIRQVCDDNPAPPRQVQAGVARDLETICLKCLHKDPRHRYQSCAEFADDLARWQRCEPIQARPFRLPERLALWARRKPLLAFLSASLLLAVMVGAAAVLWQWRRAEGLAQQAQNERDAAKKTVKLILGWLNEHYYDDIANGRWTDGDGMRPLRLQKIQEARELCEKLQRHRQDDLAIRAEIARAWWLLGRLTHEVTPGMQAHEAMKRAEGLYLDLEREQPANDDFQFGLARVWADMGRSDRQMENATEGLRHLDKAIERFEKLLDRRSSLELRYEYGMALLSRSFVLPGDEKKAEHRQAARRVLEAINAESPRPILHVVRYLCHAYSAISLDDQVPAKQFPAARETSAHYRKLLDSLPPEDQARVSVRQMRGMYENGMGLIWARQYNAEKKDATMLDAAEEYFKSALATRADLEKKNHDGAAFLVELAVTESNLGGVFVMRQHPKEAIAMFVESRDHLKRWKDENPHTFAHEGTIANCHFKLGKVYRESKNYADAFKSLRDSIDTPNLKFSAAWLRAVAAELEGCLPHLQGPQRQQCAELRAQCLREAEQMDAKKN